MSAYDIKLLISRDLRGADMNEKKGQELTKDLTGGMPCSKREMVENMLEQLCRWRKNSSSLSSSRLCEKFQLSRRECTYYLKKMLECGYIFPLENTDEIRLTSFGIARGEELGYRHETFKQFLQLAGVKPEDAEEDACRMEHVAGEKTVESICHFINSGVSSERILHHSDLCFRYETGTYEAGMGIYQMERLCPRKLAQEYYWYKEWITLEIGQEKSTCKLIRKEESQTEKLWYMDRDVGWLQAEETDHAICIPAQAFEFIISPADPIIEGELLIAFVKEGDFPTEKACRELNIHIS